MEQLYALGVSVIEFTQYWLEDYTDYFELVNHLANPYYVIEVLFPLVSIVDSVFAAQLLLCMAFGGWLNGVMKWWLLEDRPYWWVRETTFYSGTRRPQLRQTSQTCETGPGSPSGHSSTTAMVLVLAIMWISHVINDRKLNLWWWKYIVYPVFGVLMVSVMVARVYAAAHFPHQCLMGALIGALVAPALCIYVSDPYIWWYGALRRYPVSRAMCVHAALSAAAVLVCILTYYCLVLCGWDPMWTVKLAFRWCESPEDIHLTTTPMYSLVQCTGHLLGWALSVTPAVARYRHYTKERSLILSVFATTLVVLIIRHAQDNICKEHARWYYAMQFLISTIKPGLLLMLAPAIAMWPYQGKVEKLKKN